MSNSPIDSEISEPSAALANDLLAAFRTRYHRFEQAIQSAVVESADSNVLARLGDDLDEFSRLVNEYSNIFGPAELSMLRSNISGMQGDVRLHYQQVLDESHHGRPTVVETVHTGGRGRPHIHIDPEFLRWAYSLRATSSIARYLNVGRRTVRNALLEYGIAEPQRNPFADVQTEASSISEEQLMNDDLLDPNLPTAELPPTTAGAVSVPSTQPSVTSFTGPLSDLSDDALDDLIVRLKTHYRRAGITMIDGMLRRLGHRLPRERIRQSLLRTDPVQRVFERIRIRRRTYSVPGPNSLWHHDGQHGLIRWGIVIHGFIDGYSRLITGLRASDNNRAQTVFELFMSAAATYGVPSRVRGDHGIENLIVAAFMEATRGVGRGSYIWGRSVHNVRIERLWVDVTAQVGAMWHEYFIQLELHHGLDINNVQHIWLLHRLFLPIINQQLTFFAESWNQHRIQIRHGPNRSPADMFGFDMLVHGVRGNQLPSNDDLSQDELEVFGIDWEGLREERLLQSQQSNNPRGEGATSWIGRTGPPDDLSEVRVDPPSGPLQDSLILDEIQLGMNGAMDVIATWTHGLAVARAMYGNDF